MLAGRYRLADDPGVAVAHLGLACCAVEVEAAVAAGMLVPEAGHGPAECAVLLVAGTVTRPLAEAVQAARAAVGTQASVVSFGACASTGGPYWDAPSVVPGVPGPVAHYVPGCPPSPAALVAALAAIARGQVP